MREVERCGSCGRIERVKEQEEEVVGGTKQEEQEAATRTEIKSANKS